MNMGIIGLFYWGVKGKLSAAFAEATASGKDGPRLLIDALICFFIGHEGTALKIRQPFPGSNPGKVVSC
jgi:hypothetical protein